MSNEMARSRFCPRSLVVRLAFCSVLVHATMQASDAGAVAAGAWGGEHILLNVSTRGATVEFDCAHGEITNPMAVDKRGNFDVAGTFTPEHGGPVRRDENIPPAPAHYSGHVDGETMSLTVKTGKETVGIFTLSRGSPPNLTKCR